MPFGEGKKELWRRDHTLRRWAAQAAPLVRSNLAGAMTLNRRAAARATGRAGAQGPLCGNRSRASGAVTYNLKRPCLL